MLSFTSYDTNFALFFCIVVQSMKSGRKNLISRYKVEQFLNEKEKSYEENHTSLFLTLWHISTF